MGITETITPSLLNAICESPWLWLPPISIHEHQFFISAFIKNSKRIQIIFSSIFTKSHITAQSFQRSKSSFSQNILHQCQCIRPRKFRTHQPAPPRGSRRIRCGPHGLRGQTECRHRKRNGVRHEYGLLGWNLPRTCHQGHSTAGMQTLGLSVRSAHNERDYRLPQWGFLRADANGAHGAEAYAGAYIARNRVGRWFLRQGGSEG